MISSDKHTLEYLLAFNGRIHHLEQGYWLKFEIEKIAPTNERPHGLRYSFTLHDPDGKRLIGFDNAHHVRPLGSNAGASLPEHDHWHRTSDDKGRPYRFTNADMLLVDFFSEVRRVLDERGISDLVESVSDTKDRRK